MATPTTYSLSYDSPCEVEGNCGENPCGGKPEFVPRPQIFCKDAQTIGNLLVGPNQIFVGGQRYVPKTIVGRNGTFIALVRG